MPEATHCLLPAWLHPCQPKNAPVELGAIKTLLARYGINSRGWRLYLDYGDALFSPLSRPWIHPDQPFSSGPNAIAYLRILQACEMDVLPPPTLVASLARWELPDERLDRLPPLFFRAAWKAVVANSYPSYPSCKQCSPEDFVEKEVLPVARCFFVSGSDGTPNPGLLKAGWPALLLRQQLWAQEQEALAPPQKLPLGDEWNPYVRRVEWGAYRFEALTNAEQLLAEGAAMQHCVGSFADYCRSGLKRIYSVRERKSGQRVATFSLEYADDGGEFLVWKGDLLSGLKNAEVPQDVQVAADAVLRAYFDLPARTFARPVFIFRAESVEDDEWCGF